jgi:hypothetical protein
LRVVVDPHAVEIGRACGGEQRQRVVAEWTIVALEQDESHRFEARVGSVE